MDRQLNQAYGFLLRSHRMEGQIPYG